MRFVLCNRLLDWLISVQPLFWIAVLLVMDTCRAQLPPNDELRPNILWLTSEDNGPELGCYGDSFATTPNIDALATRSQRYLNCWSNAPVCAPARTTIISGMYPTSLGAQHMRSQVALPPGAQLYPHSFRQLGYYCSNNSKQDYNLDTLEDLWNDSSGQAHWRQRRAGQPFFAVFNFTISHESQLRNRPHTAIHDSAKVPLPPYHPDTPEVRQDWAQYYDRVTEMDQQVGQVLQQLADDGLAESTIVFYYGDHGSGMPRSKRWLYQSGLHVPLIVHVPERFQSLVKDQYSSGASSSRLVSFVDLMPSVLSLVGERPAAMHQGHAFLGPYATEPPQYIYGFRDRMDERYDMSRAVRDDKHLYIRNFYPQRPQGTYLDYMFQTPTTRVWKKLFDAGRLNSEQSTFWKTKSSEELYDLTADPYQIHNLASDDAQRATLERLRAATSQWMLDIRDLGLLPEGQMFELAGSDAPYVMGHDPQRYPLDEILKTADMATRFTEDNLEALLKQRTASNPAQRYWVASGLLLRAQEDQQREVVVKAAEGMTTDPSPYGRCAACETVARFGKPLSRSLAIDALLTMADPRHDNTFVAILALNSLDACQPTAAELGQRLQGLPATTSELSKRYSPLIPDLVLRIESLAK